MDCGLPLEFIFLYFVTLQFKHVSLQKTKINHPISSTPCPLLSTPINQSYMHPPIYSASLVKR